MSRPGTMPVSAAVLLTLAAALSIAEENARPSASAATVAVSPGKWTASNKSQNGRARAAAPKQDGSVASERATDSAGTGDGGQAKSRGVGSRAMMGNDEPDARGQPEMATGVDLKGPRVRFPASDTPE